MANRTRSLFPAPPTVERLVVPARLDALEAARLRMLGVLATTGAGAQSVYDAEVVLEELFSNAVRHGIRAGDEPQVAIELAADARALAITLEHDGVEFDPRTAAEPARPASLEEARVGGLGLVLVRGIADRLEYERSNGRNVVTAILRLQKPGS